MENISHSRKLNAVFLGTRMEDCIKDYNIRDLRMLLESKNADPNVLLPEANWTPFHIVAGSEDEDFAVQAAKLFLEHNGNPNVRMEEQLTPVHVAASWGHVKVLRVLLEGGGNPHLKDDLGKTAFDYAHENKEFEAVQLMIEFSEKNPDQRFLSIETLIARMQNIQQESSRKKTLGSFKNNEINLKQKASYFQPSIRLETDECDSGSDNSALNLNSKSEDLNEFIQTEDHLDREGSIETVEVTSTSKSSVDSSLEQTSSASYPVSATSQSDSSHAVRPVVEPPSLSDSSSFGDLVCSEGSGNSKRSLAKQMPSKSIARRSIMAPLKIPTIKITKPSESYVEAELTKHALAEHNSPNNLDPHSGSYLTKRIRHWVNSVSNAATVSPLAGTSTDDSYHTCGSHLPIQDRLNNAGFESDLLQESETNNSVKTCATVSECYKYKDKKQGIVLLEERWLANPVLLSDISHTDQSGSSAGVIQTDSGTCDTEYLREELKAHGIDYGPVTATTKRVYKCQLKKKKKYMSFSSQGPNYSLDLQRTLGERNNLYFMTPGTHLEQIVAEQFSRPKRETNWREGILKTSFTYLLLDPCITRNLPCRAGSLSRKSVWTTFLQSIFYIGKGKRSRPYAHLYEAVQNWRKRSLRYSNPKVKRILEIWQEGLGVICLHIFQNIIPVEAYTREAAMIDAIGLQNLCNMRRSEYYGEAAKWYSQDQKILGVFLLYKALQIFLSEGERHLSPWDIM